MTRAARLRRLLAGAAGAAGVGAGVSALLRLTLPAPGAWLCVVAGGIVLGRAGLALAGAGEQPVVEAPPLAVPPPPAHDAGAAAEMQRQLRHDIRGALSPALLTADRLLGHADPAVRRAGDIMVQAVEKAAALLAESSKRDQG